MKEQGAQVGLVCAPEPRLVQSATSLGAQVFLDPWFVRPVQPYKDMRSLLPVLRALRTFQPDLVSAHSTKAGYAARFFCALMRVRPVVFTAHGWPFTGAGNPAVRRGLAMAERFLGRFTSKIICVCQHDYELALRLKVASSSKLVVVPNGIDPEPLINASGARVREEFTLGQVPTIVMVGRLVPQKDPLTLLKACTLLTRPFRLLLVGDGELRRDVEAFVRGQPMLREAIVLAGERQDIPELLAASDVFALSSRWEGLSRAAIEAMMAGLPMVATNVGGTPELVDEGTTGFLVPAGDPESLARRLDQLLADKELRRSLGAAAKAKAFRRFTLSTMLRSTQAVYEELLVAER